MPYKDPKDRRDAVRRYRARKRTALDDLAVKVAEAGELPEPPSREYLIKALGVQAMEGNVPAIRLLLEEYRRDGNEAEAERVGAIDQLAAKRSARTG